MPGKERENKCAESTVPAGPELPGGGGGSGGGVSGEINSSRGRGTKRSPSWALGEESKEGPGADTGQWEGGASDPRKQTLSNCGPHSQKGGCPTSHGGPHSPVAATLTVSSRSIGRLDGKFRVREREQRRPLGGVEGHRDPQLGWPSGKLPPIGLCTRKLGCPPQGTLMAQSPHDSPCSKQGA